MSEEIEGTIHPPMLDPSLLCSTKFWQNIEHVQRLFPKIFFPRYVEGLNNTELRDFYGGYLNQSRILNIENMVSRCKDYFIPFDWKVGYERVPSQLQKNLKILRIRSEESELPEPIQGILLDQFVFLATQSSILSRLKKTFKMFEKLKVFPLLNLEEIVPEKWSVSIKRIKWTIDCLNWIVFLGGFSLWLGPIVGILSGAAAQGVRLFMIDP